MKKNSASEEKQPAGDSAAEKEKSEQPPAETKPSEPSSEEKLKGQIAALELALAEAKDKFLRTCADFDNYKKRAYKEQSHVRIETRIDTILPVINVFNHFKMAVAAAETSADMKVIRDGMKMIMVEFEKAFKELGIETVDVRPGQDFDPFFHEAVAKEHSEEHPEGKVLKQWRPGYVTGERMLSPAAVVVSIGPAKEPSPNGKPAEKAPEKENK